jgi:hypothetical protein
VVSERRSHHRISYRQERVRRVLDTPRGCAGGEADPRILPRRVCLSAFPAYRAIIAILARQRLPALCGIGVVTFVVSTAIGILRRCRASTRPSNRSKARSRPVSLPATMVAALHFDRTPAATPQSVIALASPGIVALVPIAIKRLRANVMDFKSPRSGVWKARRL